MEDFDFRKHDDILIALDFLEDNPEHYQKFINQLNENIKVFFDYLVKKEPDYLKYLYVAPEEYEDLDKHRMAEIIQSFSHLTIDGLLGVLGFHNVLSMIWRYTQEIYNLPPYYFPGIWRILTTVESFILFLDKIAHRLASLINEKLRTTPGLCKSAI